MMRTVARFVWLVMAVALALPALVVGAIAGGVAFVALVVVLAVLAVYPE